jgi:hypothetical protein
MMMMMMMCYWFWDTRKEDCSEYRNCNIGTANLGVQKLSNASRTNNICCFDSVVIIGYRILVAFQDTQRK